VVRWSLPADWLHAVGEPVNGLAPAVWPRLLLGVALDERVRPPLDGVTSLGGGIALGRLLGHDRIAALGNAEHRVGGELAGGGQRDAGGDGELVPGGGGAGGAQRGGLSPGWARGHPSAARLGVGHFVANATGLEVRNRDVSKGLGHLVPPQG